MTTPESAAPKAVDGLVATQVSSGNGLRIPGQAVRLGGDPPPKLNLPGAYEARTRSRDCRSQARGSC